MTGDTSRGFDNENIFRIDGLPIAKTLVDGSLVTTDKPPIGRLRADLADGMSERRIDVGFDSHDQ